MALQLRVFLAVMIVVYFVLIIKFLKKKLLVLKYALLWLFIGVLLGLLVAFPEILSLVVNALGIQLGVNALFLFGIGFTITIVMSLTVIVSHQTERIRSLVQDNAMLEKRVRELEKKL